MLLHLCAAVAAERTVFAAALQGHTGEFQRELFPQGLAAKQVENIEYLSSDFL